MAITYDAGTNTITIVGYTEASPCTFTDIYNADVAGGWGVITKQGDVQFYFVGGVRLIIGDGTTLTWFGDTNKFVEISALEGTAWQKFIDKKANANIRFGTLITGKDTKDGCAFYYYASNRLNFIEANSTSDVVDLFSCAFFINAESGVWDSDNLRMYNCISPCDFRIGDCMDIDLYNYTLSNGYIIGSNSSGTYDDVKALSSDMAIYFGYTSFDLTIKNLYSRNTPIIVKYSHTSYNIYLVNPDCDVWHFATYGGFTGKVYRQYEFDLKVIDKDNTSINGATVKIWDKDSNLIVDTTTDANGVIATQTISRGYYTEANGDTLQDASPHLIKIEKAGYTAYEADFTLEEKTDWLIALQTGGGGGLLRNPPMTGGMV